MRSLRTKTREARLAEVNPVLTTNPHPLRHHIVTLGSSKLSIYSSTFCRFPRSAAAKRIAQGGYGGSVRYALSRWRGLNAHTEDAQLKAIKEPKIKDLCWHGLRHTFLLALSSSGSKFQGDSRGGRSQNDRNVRAICTHGSHNPAQCDDCSQIAVQVEMTPPRPTGSSCRKFVRTRACVAFDEYFFFLNCKYAGNLHCQSWRPQASSGF